MTRTVEARRFFERVGRFRPKRFDNFAIERRKITRFCRRRLTRISVTRDCGAKNGDVDKVMNDALDTDENAGAVLVDVLQTLKFGVPEFEVLLYEFKADFGKVSGRKRRAV